MGVFVYIAIKLYSTIYTYYVNCTLLALCTQSVEKR